MIAVKARQGRTGDAANRFHLHFAAMTTSRPKRKRAAAPPRVAPEPRPTAQQLEDALLRRGLKRSRVREAILAAFASSDGHVSADELTARVREQFSRVSASTVYRTMNALVSAGVASSRAFGDGHSRFEPAGHSHHDHLICTRCSRVVEFTEDEIERLQDEAARRHGFEISSHKLELYGRCKECRSAAGSP